MSLKRQLCHSGAVMPLQGASYGLSIEDDTSALKDAAVIQAVARMKIASKGEQLRSLVSKYEASMPADEYLYGDFEGFPVEIHYDPGQETIQGDFKVIKE